MFVPADHGRRLDDDEDGAPVRPEPRQPSPEDPVAIAKARPLRALLKDGELLPEDEVLGSQLSSAPNRCPEENEDQLYPTHAPLPRSQTSYLYVYA